MERWMSFLFGTPRGPQQDDDEVKHEVEEKRRELNQRSAANRARLTEIQVDVQMRRNDDDVP